MAALEPSSGFIKVPPRYPVHCSQNAGVGPEQRRKGRRTVEGLMRLEGAYHRVLGAEGGGIGIGCHFGDFLRAVNLERQSPFSNGIKMRAARDDAHLLTGQR